MSILKMWVGTAECAGSAPGQTLRLHARVCCSQPSRITFATFCVRSGLRLIPFITAA